MSRLRKALALLPHRVLVPVPMNITVIAGHELT
jgi:hypothetical protein